MMNVIAFWLLAFAALCAAVSSSNENDAGDNILVGLQRLDDWDYFKVRHRKSYAQEGEEVRRLRTWKRNKARFQRHNIEALDGKHSYTLGENQFTDKDTSELKFLTKTTPPSNLLKKIIKSTDELGEFVLNERALPKSVDLRDHKCMPIIPNQGDCGACWAYSALAPIEYQKCRENGAHISLSVQQLVDCSIRNGCDGGWYETAWQYLIKANGAVNASSYPYQGSIGSCKRNEEHTVKVHSWTPVRRYSEAALKHAVAKHGPVVAAVFANLDFINYSGGIFDDPYCPTHTVNHAVVVVGYGKSPKGINYWILRNSWGSSWGMNGYMLIRRGVNRCNLGFYPAYPTAV